MKGNKFLAAVLAASMAFSAVPVTAMNAFASTSVTSETADADATTFPSTQTVKGYLDTLTAKKDSSAFGATITADTVKSTLNTSLSGGTISATTVTETDDKLTESKADQFAYHTFEITLQNSTDSSTRKYTAVLTAEKLTATEAKGIVADYVKSYISDNGPIATGDGANASLKTVAEAAATAFEKAYGVAVTMSAETVTGNGYSVTATITGQDAVTITGTANFYKDSQVTVENKTNGTSAGQKAVKQAVLAMNYKPSATADGTYNTSAIATAVTNALTGYTAQNVSVTDADNWSFEAYDSTGTYKVTIGAGADLETDNEALKTALDNYFASNEVKTTKDKTLRNTDIATIVSNDDNVKKVLNGFTITGDGNALGSDGSGKLVIKHSTTTYTYAFTADVKVSDKTEAEANKEALATVNSNTYPEYVIDGTVKRAESTSVTHNEALLQNKITADLKDAGYNTTGLRFGTASKTDATKTTNGEYKNSITNNNDVVDVALTYSSDQKLLDTENALEKFLAKGSTKGPNSTTYTEHKKTTSAVTLDDTATPADVYTYEDTSALSQKVQAKTAVTATTASDAANIVKASIDEQLTASGIADNGVTVSVKAVNTATANGKKYDVADTYKAATTDADGEITLLVTASIKNDFYGWSDGTNKDEAKTVSYSYLMKIKTNELKENKVKTISLADKTVLLTGGYYTAAKASQKDSNEVTYVEITPVIDPADANTEIKYTVYDSDKSVVDDTVKVGTDDVYKKDSDTAVKVGTNALGLKITKEGTYTIKAKADDAEATMTLTVKKNFDDVPATAYYKDATVWAYSEGVTNGVTEDLFGVNNDVTRAQYVTWLYRYAVSQDSKVEIADDDVKNVFSDVATTAYYAKAVQWAKEAGVVDGKTDTTFAPDAKITRAEAITMLWRAYGKPSAGIGSEDENTIKFTDVPTNAYYATAVTWAVSTSNNGHGLVARGTTPTTFSPNKTCSRAEGITFIYRVYAPYDA